MELYDQHQRSAVQRLSSDKQLITVFILHQLALLDASPWSTYMACLPLGHRYSGSDFEAAYLHDSDAQAAFVARNHVLRKLHRKLHSILLRLMDSADVDPEAAVEAQSFEAFTRVYSFVERAALQTRGGDVLVPFLDDLPPRVRGVHRVLGRDWTVHTLEYTRQGQIEHANDLSPSGGSLVVPKEELVLRAGLPLAAGDPITRPRQASRPLHFLVKNGESPPVEMSHFLCENTLVPGTFSSTEQHPSKPNMSRVLSQLSGLFSLSKAPKKFCIGVESRLPLPAALAVSISAMTGEELVHCAQAVQHQVNAMRTLLTAAPGPHTKHLAAVLQGQVSIQHSWPLHHTAMLCLAAAYPNLTYSALPSLLSRPGATALASSLTASVARLGTSEQQDEKAMQALQRCQVAPLPPCPRDVYSRIVSVQFRMAKRKRLRHALHTFSEAAPQLHGILAGAAHVLSHFVDFCLESHDWRLLPRFVGGVGLELLPRRAYARHVNLKERFLCAQTGLESKQPPNSLPERLHPGETGSIPIFSATEALGLLLSQHCPTAVDSEWSSSAARSRTERVMHWARAATASSARTPAAMRTGLTQVIKCLESFSLKPGLPLHLCANEALTLLATIQSLEGPDSADVGMRSDTELRLEQACGKHWTAKECVRTANWVAKYAVWVAGAPVLTPLTVLAVRRSASSHHSDVSVCDLQRLPSGHRHHSKPALCHSTTWPLTAPWPAHTPLTLDWPQPAPTPTTLRIMPDPTHDAFSALPSRLWVAGMPFMGPTAWMVSRGLKELRPVPHDASIFSAASWKHQPDEQLLRYLSVVSELSSASAAHACRDRILRLAADAASLTLNSGGCTATKDESELRQLSLAGAYLSKLPPVQEQPDAQRQPLALPICIVLPPTCSAWGNYSAIPWDGNGRLSADHCTYCMDDAKSDWSVPVVV